MSLHKAARRYAELGIPVFPCVPNGKEPACENGFKDATVNVSTIDAWWGTNPGYNIAICPEDIGLGVIDKEYNAPTTWMNGYPLPETYTVETPREGEHFYYEGSLPSTVRKLFPGLPIDTRGRGGYVLVPPSIVNGRPYRVKNRTDPAPMPGWIPQKLTTVTKLLTAPDTSLDLATNVMAAVRHLQGLDAVEEGAGSDDAAYQAAAVMRELGLSEGKALEVMREHFKCDLKEADWLAQKILNAFKFGQNAAASSAAVPAVQAFGQALAPVLAKRSRFHPEDDEEMDCTPAARWIVPGVVPEGGTIMMYGPTQSYKSFIALDIELAVATGHETFGVKPTLTGPVFYAALEGRQAIKRTRRPAWRIAKGITGKTDFHVMVAPMLLFPEEVTEFGDQIAKKCAGRMPRLIVLDTVSKMMVGMDPTRDAPKLVRFCDNLIERFPGCAVMAIHHTGHDVAKGPRDSSAYQAGFDTVLRVTSPLKNVAEVQVMKHKDVEEREEPFTFEGKALGNSLVFFPTTAAEHAQKVAAENLLERKKIGAALKALNADGPGHGVSSGILAAQLRPIRQNEEDYERAVAKIAKALDKLSRGALAAYCTRDGKAALWHLPEK